MRELHDWYEPEAISGRIVQPPFAELVDRGRRHARRTRAARLSGVAILAGLVGVPLLAVLPGDGGIPPARVPGVEFPPQLVDSTGLAYAVMFHDTRHGVAIYSGDTCQAWVSVTGDGGETWSDLRELPGRTATTGPSGESMCAGPAVVPMADGALLSLDTPDTTRLAPDWWVPPTAARISHDGGVTWQEYEPELTSVDALPEDVAVGRVCMDRACEEISLGGYDPDSGDWMVLREAPEVSSSPDGALDPVAAADGSIWIMEADREGTGRLWVSRDRGRTWQDRTPDRLGTVDVAASELATGDGQTAYLWTGSRFAREGALYRTTDGGETWRQMPAGEPFTTMYGMRVARDGTLVVAEAPSGTQFVSRDGGETFHASGTPLHDAQRLADGWLAYALDDAAEDLIEGYLSEDGLTWRPFRIPRP